MLARLVLVLSLCVSASARAQTPVEDDEARRQFAAGQRAYLAAEYVTALRAFTEAHRISHRAELLYNIGVCLEKLGRFPQAVEQYRRYVGERPDAPSRADVLERIGALETSIAQAAQLDLVRTKAVSASSPAPSRRPAYKRAWLWGVVGSVVVVAGVGLGLGLGLGLRHGDSFETNFPTGGPGAR